MQSSLEQTQKNVLLLRDNLWKGHYASPLASLAKIKQRTMQGKKKRYHIVNQDWHENFKRGVVGIGQNVFLNPEESNSGVSLPIRADI